MYFPTHLIRKQSSYSMQITIKSCLQNEGVRIYVLCLSELSLFSYRRLRRNLVPRLLICLCLSLICTILIFLLGVEETESEVTCKAIAGLLHYFLLVSFFWMAVQGFNLYRSLVTVFNSNLSDSQFFRRSFVTCAGEFNSCFN